MCEKKSSSEEFQSIWSENIGLALDNTGTSTNEKKYVSSIHSFVLPSIQVTVTETTGQAHQSSLTPAASSSSSRSEALRAILDSVVPPGCLGSVPASLYSQPCLEHLQGKVPRGAASSVNMKEQQLFTLKISASWICSLLQTDCIQSEWRSTFYCHIHMVI